MHIHPLGNFLFGASFDVAFLFFDTVHTAGGCWLKDSLDELETCSTWSTSEDEGNENNKKYLSQNCQHLLLQYTLSLLHCSHIIFLKALLIPLLHIHYYWRVMNVISENDQSKQVYNFQEWWIKAKRFHHCTCIYTRLLWKLILVNNMKRFNILEEIIPKSLYIQNTSTITIFVMLNYIILLVSGVHFSVHNLVSDFGAIRHNYF